MDESSDISSLSTLAVNPRWPTAVPKTRPQRPCDSCRKRKSRCEIAETGADCVLCLFHRQPCTFIHDPPKKRRRRSLQTDSNGGPAVNNLPSAVAEDSSVDGGVIHEIRQDLPIKDYANLRGPSLLKRTLGLQNHRHSSLVGPTSLHNRRFRGDGAPSSEDAHIGPNKTLRQVSDNECFILHYDDETRNHDQEMDDVDAIEALAAPHGQALIHLYFRIVHPTFPILHKHVFLEKYARTHREFSPPLLASVYALALDWWAWGELSALPKPDARKLEELAFKTMANVVHRPKLSTIQAGLLLHQRAGGDSWPATSQLVGLGQELGLHLDCTNWRIPNWEKRLRKRLGWALYLQDKWGSLVHGRPSHINNTDWIVQPLHHSDFPERAADEDNEDGSTEVEKGRVLFCEMIQLTTILADVLAEFYTVKADQELRSNTNHGVGWILQRAKPLQLRLKTWYSELPDCLRLQEVAMRKLSSAGYLHLAYYATEITLHRRIISFLGREDNVEIVDVCRNAARERLRKALDFVGMLRPEHLQSFWHSGSAYNFALIGSFISLLRSTSPTQEDAEAYKVNMDDYRWKLRLESKSSEILGRALNLMAVAELVTDQPVRDPTTTGSAQRRTEREFDELSDGQEEPEVGASTFDPHGNLPLRIDEDSLLLSGITPMFDTFGQSDEFNGISEQDELRLIGYSGQ